MSGPSWWDTKEKNDRRARDQVWSLLQLGVVIRHEDIPELAKFCRVKEDLFYDALFYMTRRGIAMQSGSQP